MQKHIFIVGISAALAIQTPWSIAQTNTANQTTQVTSGQWEVSVDMKGLPMGGGLKTGRTCIKPEALAAGQEKTMIEAAMGIAQPTDSNKKDSPQCKLSDFQRDNNSSRWKSSCEGPRGAMLGTGSGIFSSDSAQLTQSFEVSLPFGKRTLNQTITAKRLGECA
jgi:Protein of unknown function (DUF3617)